MEDLDPQATQAMPSDPMKTVIGAPSPSVGATQALQPVQCPVCKQHNPPGEKFCVECGLLFENGLPQEAVAVIAAPLPCLVEVATGREHPLRLGENSIGREATDVLLSDTRVSRRHATLILSEQGAEIEDVGSTNGTKLDGQTLEPGVRVPVRHGSKLFFGGFEMTITLPGEAMRTEAMPTPTSEAAEEPVETGPVLARLQGEDGSSHDLFEGEVTIGRRATNTIVIPDPYVSGSHARLSVSKDRIAFMDVGSTNGSAVNEERVEPNAEVEIHDGDVMTIGQKRYTLRILEAAE
ncbi:MAG: FHA domain-containing protein [Fimbriimonadia bacterium]|jgi:pSer/pThr/pTyr-binding forkhead associated (FHA) protein